MEQANQSILVTGCSVGFGKEIALYLAEQGYQVYATMRNLEKSQELAGEAARRAVKLRILRLDVTDEASIAGAVATIVAETGGIGGVVNNAGQIVRGYFEDLSDAEIRGIFEANFFGMLAVTRAVLPHLRQARRGRIVIISSVAGRIGSPTGSAYSASRHAQEGFAESLRQEVEPLGIYVSLIEPGITKTESWTADKGSAAKAHDPNSPYYAWFKRAEMLFSRAMDSSPITTRDVAHAVYRALSEPRPRWRYMVGTRARLVVTARKLLPSEFFNRAYFGALVRRISGAG